MKVSPTNTPDALERLIRQRVDALAYLPTAAAVAMKFIDLGKDPEADPAEYVKVISSDSSLASKLLALANSSWFGVRNKVTRPNVAVNLLGLGTVRTLAISYCLTGLHNDLKLGPAESLRFWSASLCKAVAARQFAARFDPKCAEEAFAAGLFQDVALPVIYAACKPQAAAALDGVEPLSHAALRQQERDVFRLDHAGVGRLVAQKLELPDLFVDAIAFHHDRANLAEFVGTRGGKPVVAEAAYAASLFPHVLDSWHPADAGELRQFVAERSAALSSPLDVDGFLADVQREFEQLYGYFGGGRTPDLRLPELLATATREIADQTTRLMGAVHEMMREVATAGREVHQVLARSSELEEAVLRDPLTGAFNRDGLAKHAGDLLAGAARYAAPFAVAYIDLDNFKQLNDALGHQAGDATLRKLAEIARERARPADVFARVGGDEFVLVMGDCPESAADEMVQKLSARFAAECVAPEPGKPRATLSIGLLCVAGRADPMSLDAMLSTADRLMYRAKSSGGNQVHRRALDAAPRAA